MAAFHSAHLAAFDRPLTARRSPGDVAHKWVQLSSTGHNLFGKAVLHEDSVRFGFYTCLVAWVRSGFDQLPDYEKEMVHNVLVQSDKWSDQEKRQFYSRLLELKGKRLRDFIQERIN
jgi:hypothetical protein